MTKKEIAVEIFRLLEENHKNLYHDISKEDFEVELNKFLEKADDLDNIHFDAGISRLFALFKDAHTSYFMPWKCVSAKIKYINGKYYLYDAEKKVCEEIVKVNGFDIQQVSENLKSLIAYEFDSWANKCVADRLSSINSLRMIDCVKNNCSSIEYTLANGDVVVSAWEDFVPQEKPYYSFVFEDDILIVDYFRCMNMKDYSFQQFVEDIKVACKNPPEACLVDLRGNSGGSSEIILPLIDWLKENNIPTYVLMNEDVFSSGTFALFYLKKHLGAKFVGTDAGQGGCRYGQQKTLEVEGRRFGCSEKLFDFTSWCDEELRKYFNKDHPISPDVYLPENVADIRRGIDGQKKDCFKLIQNEIAAGKRL